MIALAHSLERSRLNSELDEGMIYYITNFKVVVEPTKHSPITTEKVVIFTHETKFSLCYDACSITKFKFELCPPPTITTNYGNNLNLVGKPLN